MATKQGQVVYRYSMWQRVTEARGADGRVYRKGIITGMSMQHGDTEPCYIVRFQGAPVVVSESNIWAD